MTFEPSDGSASAVIDRLGELGLVYPIRVLSPQRATEYLARADRIEAVVAAMRIDALTSTTVHLVKPHLLLRWAWELVTEPSIVDLAAEVLGERVLIWSSDLLRKKPGDGELDWHQDAPHMPFVDHDKAVRVWVALTGSDVEAGGLRFVQGSHRAGLLEHTIRPMVETASVVEGGDYVVPAEGAAQIDVVLSPGEASVHHLRTVHSSRRNTSPYDRVGMVVTFVRPDIGLRCGPDSAVIVRGDDSGPFVPESAPQKDFDEEAGRAFRNAIDLRRRQAIVMRPPASSGLADHP